LKIFKYYANTLGGGGGGREVQSESKTNFLKTDVGKFYYVFFVVQNISMMNTLIKTPQF